MDTKIKTVGGIFLCLLFFLFRMKYITYYNMYIWCKFQINFLGSKNEYKIKLKSFERLVWIRLRKNIKVLGAHEEPLKYYATYLLLHSILFFIFLNMWRIDIWQQTFEQPLAVEPFKYALYLFKKFDIIHTKSQ